MKKGCLVSILIFVLCISTVFYALRSDLEINHYELKTDKVSQPLRIVFLSDLHSCQYGEGQQELIADIEAQQPDFVLLGGDIADDEIPHDNTRLLLEGIAGKYPCYYVSGNHEYWSGEVDAIKQMIRSCGVEILEGENRKLTAANGQSIILCGIDDYEVGEEEYARQLKSATAGCDASSYTVLLTHRPEQIQRYLPYSFDLILAGHAHGGQWRIPWILNGVYAPDQGFFPEYAAGFYTFEDSTLFVNRGLARETTRLPRIFNRPELVVLDICPQET